jgi:hypothetical protein
VQDNVLAKYPDRDVAVTVVWFNMVRTDERGRWPRDEIVDARARHLWDEGKLLGRALAGHPDLAAWRPVAWDVWLLYPAGTMWDAGTVPVPEARGRTIIRTRDALDRAIAALPRKLSP